MSNAGIGEEPQRVLATLHPGVIAGYVAAAEALTPQRERQLEARIAQRVRAVEVLDIELAAMSGGWPHPSPRITHVELSPPSGSTRTLTIKGDGFMDGCTVAMHASDGEVKASWTAQAVTAASPRRYTQRVIELTVNDLSGLAGGEYYVTVSNRLALPPIIGGPWITL